jgi:restriction endonuclease Mrr
MAKEGQANKLLPQKRQAGPHCPTDTLRRELRARLLALNFHAFARCVALLLEKMGYEDVHLAGRTDFKGHNRDGGYDLHATVPSGFIPASPRRVIVALKQFDEQMVFQKSIDQLRGTCLRVGANEALLITTGSLAPSVEQGYGSHPEPLLAPVRLMDGEMLVGLMREYLIGVQGEGNTTSDGERRVEIDERFFTELARAHEGNGPAARKDRNGIKREAHLMVTVQIERLGDHGQLKAGQLVLDGWEQ